MLLPLYVLCSKIEKKININLVYSQVSRDFTRFAMYKVGTLVKNLLVCGVRCLCHIAAHHTRSKTVKSRIF